MRVRQAEDGDTGEIREVSLATGQPAAESGADAGYLQLLRSTGTVLVAVEADGTLTGWGAVKHTPLGLLLSDLFVHPAQHGHGVGAQLLRALMPGEPAGSRRFTFSSQHANALPLYVRSGLVPSWPLLYLRGSPARLPASADVSADCVDAVTAARADAVLTSAPERSADYGHWTRRPSGTGLVVRDGSTVIAAGAGSPAELFHLTCPDPALAAAALFAAVAALGADQLAFCLPGPHPALLPLLGAGFRIEDYDISMSTPGLELPTGWIYSPGLG
ncbi:MAG: GNAT family N-acetyltransferase [Actinomycetota bacterium]